MHIKTVCAACVLALCSAPVAAQPPEDQLYVQGRPIAQERVSYRDLDLRNFTGQSQLRKRVWAASDRVCRVAEGPFYKHNPNVSGFGVDAGLNCADVTYREASPQVRAAIARARSGEAVAIAQIAVAVRAR